MLLFWCDLTDKNISDYVGTLILPEYMAHLQMTSEVLTSQDTHGVVNSPLMLEYTGVGRRETLLLSPEVHAQKMLVSFCPTLDSAAIKIQRGGIHWTIKEDVLRIFFSSKKEMIKQSGEVASFHDAYVSVSEKALFISFKILSAFLMTQCKRVGMLTENQDDSEFTAQWNYSNSAVDFMLRNRNMGGQLIFSEPESVQNLICYANLDLALEKVRPWVKYDSCREQGISIQEDGILFSLCEVGK